MLTCKKKKSKALYIYFLHFCHTSDCIAPPVCPIAIWMTVLCPQYDWKGSHYGEFMFAYFFLILVFWAQVSIGEQYTALKEWLSSAVAL